ncbi:PREDICTED: uncharacterized protein LOC104595051 isoform X2 [Nelumbo nucifera]|uniref:Uncharacterized protein LOC104595051 isoform X2 n=1 Tax=Nelumbo nucifera TaxID=4432 RepID=A0A1U7ZYY8_NELNU|nr:PREDICTED: uncharacterized protein LOC104595051 isoform X2 [Nelumbo nucifera]
MVNDIQSHKKIKGCDNNHSGRGDIGASIISDFATTDTSALRRLTKQLPSKKKTVLISAITQKSEGLEKQILPTAPVKRRAERVEKKKMPSPVRKSDGNEKQCSLSSSESKKTRNGFSTLDTKREKKGDRCGKKLLFDVREQSSRSEELTHVSLRKKRLDARSYRALISSQSSLAKELNGNNIGTRDSIEGKEGAEECTELKGEEQRKQDMAGGGERSTEGSNSGELSSFIQKHKIHPDDEQDSENGDGLAVSKYSHSSLHSSPNGIIGKETVDDAKKDCPAREDLQTSESIESTSEGRLLSADADIGMDEKSGAVKRNAMDMDSDASVAAASKEICSFTADIVSSSPSGGRRGNTIESCSICSKRQRVDLDSRSQVVCSCKQKKKGSSFKLSKFPNGVPPGLDNCHLRYVNRLRECWHKDQNALIIDDQERVIRVVLFILSLQPDVCRPFLIISSSTVLSVWEAQFLHVAPSVNVIVYDGSKDVRKTLRSLKFYKEGGCIMFHVLLSPPDAIIEDLEILECLGWEAIIVDECQQYGVAKHLEQIKMLTTGFRLLISRGQVKDSITEQLNLLSFLDPGTEKVSTDGLKGSNMSKLKERLAQFIAFEHKLNSSKFVEYWVPVQLSNVQLEQYCATLLSNSMLLRSNSKNDIVEALRDILISARKCCDHPYLVDQSLQSLLTKGLPETEYLDIGVKASGKLQLLDCILSAIKDRGLRVLILFQSIGGSGRNSIGDILDDFLRQRFGPDSYERIDSGLLSSKRQTALNLFNKEKGRFIFLLENRACHPSIKLFSVDTVILFGSDWNPFNDLKALQRITIDSQFQQLKVFRLYSSCTMEEKVLILAKQDATLDSNVQNINRNTSHTLLIWGASHLFNQLDEFHGCTTPDSGSNYSSEQLMMNVVGEMLMLLTCNTKNNDTRNCSIIAKVQQSGTAYPRDVYLFGESERQLTDEVPHLFWEKLLEGRKPQWKYTSRPSQRVRKKVQYFDEMSKKPEVPSDENIKKQKVVNNTIDPISLRHCLEDERKGIPGEEEGRTTTQAGDGSQSLLQSTVNTYRKNHVKLALSNIANDISKASEFQWVESEGRKLRNSQNSLHLFLKPEISKLCEILQFPEDVKGMAGRFLEYIMNNHRVSREPATILQAFEISLCWAAASLLKYKIDHSDSLERVKQLLNFNCKEEEVEYVYSKLRVLKKVFSRHTENVEKSNLTRIDTPKTKDIAESLLPVMNSQPAASAQQQLEGDIRESSESNNCFGQEVSLKQGHAFKNANGLIKNEFSNNVELVENIFAERLKRLLQKQQEEVQKFNKIKEKEKAELEKQCQVEAVLTRTINSNLVTRLDKLKRLDQEHSRKMEQFSHHMELQQKNLENLLLAARNEEKRMTAHWLEQAKSGRPMEEISKLPLPNIVLNFEKLEASEKGAPISDPSLEKQYPDGNVPTVVGGGAPSRILESVPDGVDNVCSSMGTVNPAKLSSRMDASTMSGGTVPSEIANNVDRGRISMKTLSLTTQSSGMDASIVPDGVVLSKGLETVPNEVHRDSIPMEKFTSTMQTIGLDVTGMSGGVVPFEVLDTSSNEVGRLSIPVETFTPSMQSIGLNIPVVPGGVLPPEVPEEVDESNIPMEVVNPSLQPSRLDGGMCTVASDRIDLAEVEQHTMASSPNNGEISPLELTEIGTSSDHVMSAQGNTLPSSQVLSVEHPGPPISTSVQVEDLGYFDGKNPPQQVKVPALQPDNVAWPDQSNHNILVTSPSMQLQLSPSTDPTSKHNQLDVTLVTGRCEPGKEGGTSCQQAQLQIEDLAQLPNHSVAQPVTDSSPGSLTGTPVGSIGLPVSDPRSMGTHPESSSCQQTVPSGGSEVHILDTISVVTVSESSSCAPSTVPVIPQVAPPFHHDLLQEELKRIHEEKEQTIKIHKDMKVQLQFQCDKEIEEIRKKYSAQLHNADITFMQREKELVVNYNKVLMNQILAKTLRTIDQQVSGVYSSLFQQLLQLPGLQQVQKPPTDAGPSASSPLQVVHHFWELFSSSPVRSQFNPVVPSTGNLQVGTEPQALATHLQTFRPVTSMSVPNPPSIPHLMPTQNFLGNTATTPAPSSMPGPCTVPSQQSLSNPATTYSVQHLFAPHLLTNPLLTRESHQMEIAGALPIFHNTSMSSLDLLMDIDNSHFTSQPQMLQTHLQSNPTMDMPDTSTLVTASGLQGAAASSCTTDVVCLSDDD